MEQISEETKQNKSKPNQQQKQQKTETSNQFKNALKQIKLPFCQQDLNHSSERLNNICFDSSCQQFMQPVCSECANFNSHQHSNFDEGTSHYQQQYLLYKRFLIDLEQKFVESKTEQLWTFDINFCEKISKECKILSDKFSKLADKYVNMGSQIYYQSKEIRQMFANFSQQDQYETQEQFKYNLGILSTYIMKNNSDNGNQKNNKIISDNSFSFSNLVKQNEQKIDRIKEEIVKLLQQGKTNFEKQDAEFQLSKMYNELIKQPQFPFVASNLSDSSEVHLINQGQQFILGNSNLETKGQQVYSLKTFKQQGKYALQLLVDKFKSGNQKEKHFWISLLKHSQLDQWFSEGGVCHFSLFGGKSTSIKNIKLNREEGNLQILQFMNQQQRLVLDISIDIQQNQFLARHRETGIEYEFQSESDSLDDEELHLCININDGLSAAVQVLEYRCKEYEKEENYSNKYQS